ncbi:MAG: VOC family protein [Caulobacteraceae bacterium]
MVEAPQCRTLSSAVCYQDPKAAVLWLEAAFGFEQAMMLMDAQGQLAHAEMTFGDSMIMVASEWSEKHRSPKSIGGANTQTVHVQLDADLDGHCERARRAGAVIQQEPETQFYGDRTYRAVDPEGHIWTFGQTVAEMTSEDWDKAGGFTTRPRL